MKRQTFYRKAQNMRMAAGCTIMVRDKGGWVMQKLWFPGVYGVLHVKRNYEYEEVRGMGELTSRHQWKDIQLSEGFQLYEANGCMCIRDVVACAKQRVMG